MVLEVDHDPIGGFSRYGQKALDVVFYDGSGMSGVAYARQHGINYTTLASWVQRRRRKRGDHDKTKPRGIAPAKSSPMELTLAQVVVESPPPVESGRMIGSLRVELPGGVALVIDNAGQAAMAAELIRLVNQSK